jgi:hypothetical protein
MNNCSNNSELRSDMWIDGVTFTKVFVSLLDGIFLECDIKISFELSANSRIHIEMQEITIVAVLNGIFISG